MIACTFLHYITFFSLIFFTNFFCYYRSQKNSLKPFCRSSIGIPIYYKQVFGDAVTNDTMQTIQAKALLLTYLVNNGPTAGIAAAWEKEYLKVLQRERQYVRLYYTAEVS